MIVKSYGLKVSRRPEYAGVDANGVFFPVRKDDPKCVGQVIRTSIPDEPMLAKLYLEWEVEYWLEGSPAPAKLNLPQRVDVESSSSIKIELPIQVSCELAIMRGGVSITPPHKAYDQS